MSNLGIPIVLYRNACPNCGGEITSDRLILGLPCHRCLPDTEVHKVKSVFDLIQLLKTLNRLREFEKIDKLLDKYREFSELFEKIVGAKMWGAQRLWTRRLIKGKSFAIIAPTGSGKTTFGLIASIYIARNGGKVLFVLPTSTLAYQVYKKAINYIQKSGLSIRVVTYNVMLSKSEKEQALNEIKSGNFDILIITNAFLPKHMDLLRKYKFDLIFVDDVDSVLKASSKNIDRLLILLGVPEDILTKALKGVELVKEIRRLGKISTSEEELNRLRNELRKIEEEIREFLKQAKIGILIASGALTKTRRTARLLLFREFLGFETGGKAEGLRNIVDTYIIPEQGKELSDIVVDIVKKLGDGGIIYIPTDLGREYAIKIEEKLREVGIKAYAYLKPKREVIDKFSEGEIDVLIGLATPRSALVRGIDLPHRVKYVIFVGVPKLRFRLKISEFTPGRYITLFFNLRNIVEDKNLKQEIDRLIVKLRLISNISQTQLDKVLQYIQEGKVNELSGFERYVADIVRKSIEFANKLLLSIDKEVLRKSDIYMELIDNDLYIVLPDSVTYIQGSGRTSRMYVGGITKGLSIVIVDNEKVFNALVKDLKYRIEEVEFRKFDELNIDEIMKEINEERKFAAKVLKGEIPTQFVEKDPLKSVLIIVESPTKARTIANFFGRPSIRTIGNLLIYEVTTGNYLIMVTATKGHIWELVPDASNKDLEYIKNAFKIEPYDYYGVLKVGKNFVPIYNTIKKCPTCGETFTEDITNCLRDNTPLIDSKVIIDVLRDLATEVDMVLLGTDPDAEGEKISWDVYLMLKPYVQDIKRIEFHEVTKKAIFEAISNPRFVHPGMVKAQLVRRIEDRWIGFGLSQKLWEVSKKLLGHELRTLSAGRVQTPVLGWIIHRYYEARRRQVYRISITLNTGHRFTIDIPVNLKKLIRDISEKKAIVEVKDVKEEIIEINPLPPYTTDSLLKDASNILRISVEEAMRIAQELFEIGLITYHRTDSTRVSTFGISLAKEYIVKHFGSEEFVPRQWIISGHIGAHECIRPTRIIDVEELRNLVNSGILQLPIRLTPRHYAMYDLIFRRFIASQMKSAIIKQQKFKLIVKSSDSKEIHEEEVEKCIDIIYPGFLKVLPIIKPEQQINEGKYEIVEASKPIRTTKIKPLREGDLIALMKEKGIGRPSTYARIVDVILRRRYAITVGRLRYLIPTKKGIKVYYYLTKDPIAKELLKGEKIEEIELTKIKDIGMYKDLVSEERTRLVEELMDNVEGGEKDYLDVLNELFEEAKKFGILK